MLAPWFEGRATHTIKSCLSLLHTHTVLGAPVLLAQYPVSHAPHTNRSSVSVFHTYSTGGTNSGSAVTCASRHTYLSITSLSHTYTLTALGRLGVFVLYPVSRTTLHATHTNKSSLSLSLTHTHSAENTDFASGVSCE